MDSQPTLTDTLRELPEYPIEFLRNTLLYDSADLLTEWLRQNAPEPVIELFEGMTWFWSLENHLQQNGGKINEEMKRDSLLIMPSAVQAAKKLRDRRKVGSLTKCLGMCQR